MVTQRETLRQGLARFLTPVSFSANIDINIDKNIDTIVPKNLSYIEDTIEETDQQVDKTDWQVESESKYFLFSEHYQDLEREESLDSPPSPPLPPSSLTYSSIYYPASMSDLAVTGTLNEAAKMKKLNEPDDWVKWNQKLRGYFGIVNL